MHKNKKFISIIWGYHKQIFSFEKEQNYHMHPIQVMINQGYECEIFSIDASVRIEDDPNFIPGVNVIYFKNIFQYILYLFKNRSHIIYSNSLTIKTLLVGIIGKRTVFYPHDNIFGRTGNNLIKKHVIRFFYSFFSVIRINNSAEKKHIDNIYENKGFICPLVISDRFLYKNYHAHSRKNATFIGNLTGAKNPYFLIEAAKILNQKGIQFVFTIMGDDRIGFIDHVKELGLQDYFSFTGFLDPENIYKYLKESLVYINTSKGEGQCLAVYEAALAGNILCLPNILSFPSVFAENAYYHDSPNQLVENIEKILATGDKENNMIKDNQNMILDKYNYDRISEKLGDMFIKL